MDTVIERLIKGEEYTDEHRKQAIEAGMRSYFEEGRKVAGFEGVGRSLPYLLLVPPVLAAMGGDMTGRAHHRIELAASKRRNQGVSSTQERLRALAEIAQARGGFEIPGEGEPQEAKIAPRKPQGRPDRSHPQERSGGGEMVELLD